MTNRWQLQQAKDHFSEVVKHALLHGPQFVTKHKEAAVVVLSLKDYERLAKPKGSLVAFFRKSPLRGVPLNLRRDKSLPRPVKL